MTSQSISNDRKLIARFPAEIWGKIFDYCPQQGRIAQISKAFQAHIEAMRGRFLENISVEPNIYYTLNLIDPTHSNSQKIRILSEFIYRPIQERQSFFVQHCRKGIDEIFVFACKYKKDRAQKLLDMGLVSEEGIDQALRISLLAKNIDNIDLLLPRASENYLNRNYCFITQISHFPEAFERLLKSKRAFNVGIALEALDAKGTALLLQSKRQINPNYYEFPDVSDSSRAGLHSALIFSAGEDNLEKVKAILTYGKPSKQILQHVRNRVQFYKDHGHLGERRLSQLTHTLLNNVKFDHAIHRNQILALLDEAIAHHPQIEPAIVFDPPFEIPLYQLVPQNPLP